MNKREFTFLLDSILLLILSPLSRSQSRKLFLNMETPSETQSLLTSLNTHSQTIKVPLENYSAENNFQKLLLNKRKLYLMTRNSSILIKKMLPRHLKKEKIKALKRKKKSQK